MGAIIGIAVAAGILLLLVILLAGMYNTLVRKRIDCDNGFSQIDVQLKRRYDLIPNLVETVKGYAAHESKTLEAVIAARNQAMKYAGEPNQLPERLKAEGELSGALSRLMVVSEAYPDLKANSNFLQLQEELTSTENKIGFSRQHYNDCVGRYEEARQSFPTNLVAAAFSFKSKPFFEVTSSAEREAPKVKFG